MKFFIFILFSCVSVILAEPGWFSSLSSSNLNSLDDDVFAKAYSEAKSHIGEQKKMVEEKDKLLEGYRPKFEEGSFGSYAKDVLKSANQASRGYIDGMRNAASEMTKTMLETATDSGLELLLKEYKMVSGATMMGSKLSLPEIQTSLYGCQLQANNGSFQSLSSLEKDGKVQVTIESSDSVILEVPMKFNEMKITYNYFKVGFSFLSLSGKFTVNVGKNSLIIKLRLGMDSTCALSLEKVSIKELENIEVKFDGLGTFGNSISNKLTNTIIYYLENVIKNQIQDAVDSNLRKALDNNSMICSGFVPK